jgi:hypothetical protein
MIIFLLFIFAILNGILLRRYFSEEKDLTCEHICTLLRSAKYISRTTKYHFYFGDTFGNVGSEYRLDLTVNSFENRSSAEKIYFHEKYAKKILEIAQQESNKRFFNKEITEGEK